MSVEASPVEACKTCGSFEHYSCHRENGMFSIMGHPKFFGAIIGKCEVCNSYIGSAQSRCDSTHCVAAGLQWWAKDQHGWPIERHTNRPAWRYWARVLAQNLRKVTG